MTGFVFMVLGALCLFGAFWGVGDATAPDPYGFRRDAETAWAAFGVAWMIAGLAFVVIGGVR